VTRRRLAGLVAALLLLVSRGARANFAFPDPPPPEEYGNLLMDRASKAAGVKAVSFSHWLHRATYACRVCHFELQFNFKAGTTEITEAANRAGQFCGACHDGKELFGHTKKEDCERCHNGDLRRGAEQFVKLWRLPVSKYGNLIDWQAALDAGKLEIKRQLTIPPSGDVAFGGTIFFHSSWTMGPDAVFPHGAHIKWLDCNDCHPDNFSIRKQSTEGLRMVAIVNGEYCGVCHGRVAFPLQDCVRCHPKMRTVPDYKKPARRLGVQGR
jgi:c(7)-type cytochrome triheme protein